MDETLLNDLQRTHFNFFWKLTNTANGLVPDRASATNNEAMSSIAGHRIRPDGLHRRRRTRLRHARRSGPTDGRHATDVQRCAERHRPGIFGRIQGILLSFSEPEHQSPGRTERTLDDRHRTADGRYPVRPDLLRPGQCRRKRNPAVGRRTVPRSGLEMGDERGRTDESRLDSRIRLPTVHLAGLQRSHDPLHPRNRLARDRQKTRRAAYGTAGRLPTITAVSRTTRW